MRTGTKLKAGGAVLLSCAAVAGGMLVTSRAMAEDTPAPTGTLTIVSMTAGDDQPVSCTYDDVELPAAPAGTPQFHDEPTLVTGGAQEAGGPTLTGSGPEPGSGAGVVVSGRAVIAGAPLPSDAQTVSFDSATGDARQGTAEECAAMRATLPTP